MNMPATDPSRPVVLITGGATGVGRACALRFAEAAHNVVINYSRSENEAQQTAEQVRAKGSDCMVHRCDVSDEAEVKRMMERIADTFGRLDVLVNNAAMTHFIPFDNLEDMTEDKWDRILAVNTKGPFFCIKAARSLLMDREGGSVVNVSSVAGLTGQGSCIAYAASKAALNALTKSFARSLAPRIRVNAVLPGPIDSRWIRDGENDWSLDEMTVEFPITRASSPEDIADGVIFLATGTRMTTGQLLAIDGGQTI